MIGDTITLVESCVVCYSAIREDEPMLVCTDCQNAGHKKHIEAWLSKKKICPVCSQVYSNGLFVLVESGGSKHTYNLKMKLRKGFNEVFQNFSFRYNFYDFQVSVLTNLLMNYRQVNSQVLVMPPGGGKTIIALQAASALQVNTLILVPNLAVMGSWFDRAEMFFEEGDKVHFLQDIMGKDYGALHPLTVITYSRLNTEMKNYLKNLPLKKGKFREEEENFIERLKDHDIGLMIIDEAHKLTSRWGEVVKELYDILDGKTERLKLLGLTATPPKQSTGEYEGLFQKTIRIELPPLVREGIIAPYQDLVYVITVPDATILDTELDDLREVPIRKYRKFDIDIRNFLLNKGRQEIRWLSTYKGIMDYSTIYLHAAMEVISAEYRTMGDRLRALMIYDRETNNRGGYNAAKDAFYACIQDSEIDKLNPILMTGSSLYVDDDFADELKGLHETWCEKNGVEIWFKVKKMDGYVEFRGTGRDHSTDTTSRFITSVFESGRTKLLIGTRHLLGEGWDSLRLNTIIDMTFNTNYATVNQIKGRAFRILPQEPRKVSNIWEFILDPAISERTYDQYLKFVKRHKDYYGIDMKGEIRSGVSRIDPNFSSGRNARRWIILQGGIGAENITARSFNRASSRPQARLKWKVGEKIGEHQNTIRINLHSQLPRYIKKKTTMKDKVLLMAASILFGLPEMGERQFLEMVTTSILHYINAICTYYDAPATWDFDPEEIARTYPELIYSIPITERFAKHEELIDVLTSDSPIAALEFRFCGVLTEMDLSARWISRRFNNRISRWFVKRFQSTETSSSSVVCLLPLPVNSIEIDDFVDKDLYPVLSDVVMRERPSMKKPIEAVIETRYKT